MNSGKKPNAALRRERDLRGWSQRRVAEEIGTSEDIVSRWERGDRLPEPYFRERLCTLFGKDAEELGLIPKRTQYSSIVIATQTTDISDKLDSAESIINLSWEAWFASRPKQAAHEVTKLLPSLEKIISTSVVTIHVLRAKALITRGHGLLGAIYLDAVQNDAAFYHYMCAHKFAEEIHDEDLTATYLCLIGEVLRRQKDPSGALSRMEDARDKTSHASKATRGHILQLLAYTYGETEQEAAFEDTISEATDLLAFSGEGRDTAQKEFIPFEVYEIRGKINRDLGKPLDALPYLELAEQSLSQSDSVTLRWLALLEISRSQAYCDAGDIATGIDLACKGFMKARQCRSHLQMNRVRKLLRKLERSSFRNHPKIQDLKNLLFETYINTDDD